MKKSFNFEEKNIEEEAYINSVLNSAGALKDAYKTKEPPVSNESPRKLLDDEEQYIENLLSKMGKL